MLLENVALERGQARAQAAWSSSGVRHRRSSGWRAYVDLYLPTVATARSALAARVDVWRSRRSPCPSCRETRPPRPRAGTRHLVRLVESGVAAGEFAPLDAEAFSVRLRAMLDGSAPRSSSACRGSTAGTGGAQPWLLPRGTIDR
ncbi:TetR family transcriptional regulator C-terminal domain-containing protein [Nonomuraea dietziae]|uniref:TetR family transcriptional regulator C-terminal domain-containing protein n=1 Tax=Nonomuraea dietziae TaxID=65515 RepID=UPI0031DA5C5A